MLPSLPKLLPRLLAPPLLAGLVLLFLLSTVTGALRVTEGLAILSPRLVDETRIQDRELDRGGWHDLLVKYHNLLLASHAPADIHYLLGRLYLRLGLVEPARVQLEECVDLAPRHPLALEELAHCLVKLGELEEAEEILERAEALNPTSVNATTTRAALLVQRGVPEGALRVYVRLIRRGLGTAPRVQAALCLYLCGRLDKAIRLLHALLLREPRLAPAREILSLVLIRQGRFQEACNVLEQAPPYASAAPRSSRIHRILRQVIAGTLPEQAVVSFFQAQALPRSDLEGRRELLTETLRAAPRFAEAHLELALPLLTVEPTRALAYLEAAAAAAPENGEVLFRLGLLYHDLDRPADAARTLEHAASASPSDPEIRIRLGSIFTALDRRNDALHHFRRAINLRPTDPRPYAAVGRLLAADEVDHTAEAAAYLREALLLNPSDTGSSTLLAHLCRDTTAKTP